MKGLGLPSPKGASVLAVDDQPENLELLEEILVEEGFRVRLAADGEEALSAVAEELPDCIVLDVMMPRLDGFHVCRRLKSARATCFVPIVMLTALTDVTDKVLGLNLGADDYLNKPVSPTELVARVRSLVKVKRLRDELDTAETIVFSMARALDAKDPASAGHSERVAVTALRLARHLGLPASESEAIVRGAMLHDLGKVGVPEEALAPEPRLTPDQLAARRRHPELGEQILSPLLSFAAVREIVRHHHERLDGSGYPDGLSGNELTLGTEIVALANAFDGLIWQGRSPAQAGEALRAAAAAGQYHRDLVEELLRQDATLPVRPDEPLPDWQELLPPLANVPRGRILVGASQAATRQALCELIEGAGHLVIAQASPSETAAALESARPDLVVLDAGSDRQEGLAVVRQLKALPGTEFLPVLLCLDSRSRQERTEALKAGADDFLPLPLNGLEVVARVKSLLRLQLYFRDLEEYQGVVLSLATALEAKDPYTRGHSERVGLLAARMARELGYDDEFCERMRVGGLLHDLGKIGVPERLLNKSGGLTEAELRTVLTHPDRGTAICEPLRAVQSLLPLIRYHHERFDGRGYPEGLRGEAIPFGARLLSVADAYDALTSDRSYRLRLPPDEALAVLEKERDEGRWDPQIVAVLASLVRRGTV
ncbi:MAG: response regulator [Acidobacteria bacterium]|nr:MAG: response regulator [Acidobacteriota bacterium]MCE7958529.1 response regulator [Acidobacteria bacterium ACB2]